MGFRNDFSFPATALNFFYRYIYRDKVLNRNFKNEITLGLKGCRIYDFKN